MSERQKELQTQRAYDGHPASGVPPMSGLIAAIVGGLFMSRVTGSFITISGPAAGLIVVNLGAVESLGQGDMLAGYKYALAAFLVAGIIQMIFGFLKVGKFDVEDQLMKRTQTVGKQNIDHTFLALSSLAAFDYLFMV